MLAPGTLLQDRYRIVAQIGKGGMGAVYQARDLRLRNDVALKETLFNDDTYRRAFEREAQILARLRHQALPRVIDHFVEGNGQFLVMEYIGGEDLGAQLARLGKRFASPQALPIVLRWADQLLDVLHYLHTRPSPVIHRDIKPKNLKLSPQTHDIILLDFGLSRGGVTVQTSLPEGDEPTTPESRGERKVYGFTPPYAPFEQMRDAEPDPRSDIYSLAATLYHMLTGALPADAMTRMARLLNAQPDSLRPIRDQAPHVPAGIAGLIERGLAVLIDNRPPGAREMRDELASLRGQPLPRLHLSAQPPPPAGSAPGPQPGITPSIATGGVTASGAVTPSAVPGRATPVVSDSLPVGTLVRRLISGSPIRAVAFNPSGDLLAAGYDNHTAGIWRPHDGALVTTLRGHTSGVRSLAFSPSGAILATGSDDETVRLWSVQDGLLRSAVRIPACQIESICFSPDGMLLAAGGWGSAISIFMLNADRVEPIGSLPCPFVQSLTFSPDGRYIAAGCYDGAVYLWRSADLHAEGTLSGFVNVINSVAFSPDSEYLAASSHTQVRVWRMSDRLVIESLQGHAGPVRSVAFSPDSHIIATASEDRSARFWRLSDGVALPISLDHSAGVTSITFSPNGRLLAAGTHDGRISIWHAPQ